MRTMEKMDQQFQPLVKVRQERSMMVKAMETVAEEKREIYERLREWLVGERRLLESFVEEERGVKIKVKEVEVTLVDTRSYLTTSIKELGELKDSISRCKARMEALQPPKPPKIAPKIGALKEV